VSVVVVGSGAVVGVGALDPEQSAKTDRATLLKTAFMVRKRSGDVDPSTAIPVWHWLRR
jgi:hypothetical protein